MRNNLIKINVILLLLLFPCSLIFGKKYGFKYIDTKTGASFRGLSVVDNHVAWVSGSKGWVGKTTDGGATWDFSQVKGYEQCDFRCLYAFDSKTAVIANSGAPAYILFTTDGGLTWSKTYENTDTRIFFDGLLFLNKKDGIIFGDPIEGHLFLMKLVFAQRHNPNHGIIFWRPVNSLPATDSGEASFAASGTTIRSYGKKILIATGGKVSRLFFSDRDLENWKVVNTPIIQGTETTGIFSVAHRAKHKAIIMGGDYKQETLCFQQVYFTENDGLKWNYSERKTRGYRECVEYLGRETAIATGPTGSEITHDGGKNWAPLSDEKGYHVIRKSRKGHLIVMAGSKGMIAVLNR
jgi:photosystem II stability/assembly factor-like uncharacterized protein